MVIGEGRGIKVSMGREVSLERGSRGRRGRVVGELSRGGVEEGEFRRGGGDVGEKRG